MRRVVLTGCTRGLGRALARRLTERNCVVFGCGRSEEAVAEVRRELGPTHDFSAVDVADREAVAAWSKRILDEHGPPDLLINNAALMNTIAPLWTIDNDEFEALVNVNIKGVFNVTRAFVPSMVDAGRGVVVNLSSGWGRSVDANVAPYCATKWAVEGLTLALAEELPEPLAAVPLNPGVIDTDMLRSAWGDGAASAHKPEEWSHAAADLILSIDRRHNGQQLAVSLTKSRG